MTATYLRSSMPVYAARRGIQLAIDLWLLSIALFVLGELYGPSCRDQGTLGHLAHRRLGQGIPNCVPIVDRNALPIRYLEMVGGLLRGDFGRDATGHAALPIVAADILPILAFVALCWVFVQAIAVPLAVFWTMKRGTAVDGLLKALSWVGIVTPGFFVIFIILGWFVVHHWLPDGLLGSAPRLLSACWLAQVARDPLGALGASAEHLVSPVLAVVLFWGAARARLLREALGRVADETYIRTARAKGLGAWRTMFRHALTSIGPTLPGDTGLYVWVLAVYVLPFGFFFASNDFGDRDTFLLVTGMYAFGILLMRLLGDLVAAWRNPAMRETGGLGFS